MLLGTAAIANDSDKQEKVSKFESKIIKESKVPAFVEAAEVAEPVAEVEVVEVVEPVVIVEDSIIEPVVEEQDDTAGSKESEEEEEEDVIVAEEAVTEEAVIESVADEAATEEESAHSQSAAYNPETGEINWDCPCLGGMANGPCGEEFKEAFACFVYSETEPKGIDCIKKFENMRTCFRQYPEHYREELYEDEEVPEVESATEPAPVSTTSE